MPGRGSGVFHDHKPTLHMIKVIKATTLLLLSSMTLGAQTFDTGKMDSLLQILGRHNKVMGSVAIGQKGKIVYTRALGYADAESKLPATVQTRYRIGSISKMFTATMIFQLIEKKKLSLATTLDKFYPTVPNAAQITIADLLQHRSGIHNFTDADEYTAYHTQPKTHDEIVALIVKGGSDFTPNEKAAYSNSNYVLLGYIIEQLYKQPYPEVLTNQVIKKAGLTSTYYGGKINTAAQEARSYHYADSTLVPEAETDMSIPGGAGAIVSTPSDLTRFINALFAGKLVSPGNLELMKTVKDHYGMGMFEIPFHDRVSFGHSGGIDGFSSMLAYFPKEDMSIAYTTNALNYNMNEALIGMLSIYFGMPYTLPEFKTVVVKPGDLDQYTGTYASTQIPLKITITKDVNVLFAQATGQPAFALTASGPGEFSFDAAGIRLIFDPANGKMTLKQSGQTFEFHKEP